ncbi:MAG: hypothetical protein CMJ31_09515 [Phycisphaerae bacterium]|nr:hypothetical protein [Phycisphaerae bacterium]
MSSPAFKMTRVSDVCAATDRPFEPGDPQVTALFDDPDAPETLIRRDYHAAAWDGFEKLPAGVVAYWRHPARAAADSGNAINPGDVMEVFEQIEINDDEPNPQAVALRYVLALMLVRKRLLVPAANVETTAGVLRLVRKDSPDDVLDIAEPSLSADEVEALGRQLVEVLDG